MLFVPVDINAAQFHLRIICLFLFQQHQQVDEERFQRPSIAPGVEKRLFKSIPITLRNAPNRITLGIVLRKGPRRKSEGHEGERKRKSHNGRKNRPKRNRSKAPNFLQLTT